MKPESEVRKHAMRISRLLGVDCVELFVNVYEDAVNDHYLSVHNAKRIIETGFPLISELRAINYNADCNWRLGTYEEVIDDLSKGATKAEHLLKVFVNWSKAKYPAHYKFRLNSLEMERANNIINIMTK